MPAQQLTLAEAVGGSDASGAACPTCGDRFETENGMKVHHVQAHDESIASITVECAQCGTIVTKYQSKVERSDRNFCSPQCHGAWKSENLVGENNPQWDRVTVECAQCGATDSKYPCEVKQSEHNFCSDQCRGAWDSENLVGENNPQWDRVTVECAQCGTDTSKKRHEVERSDRNFCSPQCWYAWHSGENHSLWDPDSHDVFGPNWDQQARLARERDNYRCQNPECGMDRAAHLAQYGQAHPVHHNIPRKKFIDEDGTFDYEAANKLSNLITFCNRCHPKWEGVPIDLRGVTAATPAD